MKKIIVGVVGILLTTACTTTKYITVDRVRTDTTYIHQQQRDSIYVHDSVAVSSLDDTLRIERWHTRYVERTATDTIYKTKTDSVPVPYPKTEYVERTLTWWQQTRIHAGEALLALLGIALGWFAVKRFIIR